MSYKVRCTQPADFNEVIKLCHAVYPGTPVWTEDQLKSHLAIYPEGQFVAVDESSGEVVGMSASLIINWDDYDFKDNWKYFTDAGLFTNHDPVNGRTLYAAEIMVAPEAQGTGVGSLLYEARENLAIKSNLLRIRAGARLRGYSTYADELSPDDYVLRVIRGEIFDPTLSFQLKRGFRVLHIVSGYLSFDEESLGYAAVIEWLNEKVAEPSHYNRGSIKFQIPGKWS
ncbi:MAG: GNAT family N-acetyltransferase [Bdellovibrio sp.]|nr:GNAT family N-acetyltransferase [Bdellovibrio sp.]